VPEALTGNIAIQLLMDLISFNAGPFVLTITKGCALEIPGRRSLEPRRDVVDSTGRQDG
jgi:hypothetical protein